jgi:hypothetical protein
MHTQPTAADPNAIDVVGTQQTQAVSGKDSDHPQESFNMAAMDDNGDDDVDANS